MVILKTIYINIVYLYLFVLQLGQKTSRCIANDWDYFFKMAAELSKFVL